MEKSGFLQLAGNIPECFWLVDANSQRVTYISKAYEQIWGRYVEALYADALDWQKHVHVEDKDRVSAAMKRHRCEAWMKSSGFHVQME